MSECLLMRCLTEEEAMNLKPDDEIYTKVRVRCINIHKEVGWCDVSVCINEEENLPPNELFKVSEQ